MSMKHINLCLIGIFILLAACLYSIHLPAQEKGNEDTTAARLLQVVRNAFNQNNEQKFYA